jgi:murein DD-endopeptidase MepM/ murein hydrolase activator NlpD
MKAQLGETSQAHFGFGREKSLKGVTSMRKQIFTVILSVCLLLAPASWAHTLYVKANPTNQNGIEFGVDNASGFTRWRAYVYLGPNGNPGQNSGWKSVGDGWWYYDLSTITQRVMWRLDGITNKTYKITYWAYRSDGTWDYGPQVDVISDQIIPDAQFTNLTNNLVFTQATFNCKVASSDNLSGVQAIRVYVVTPGNNCAISGWLPSGITNQYYQEFNASAVDYNFTAPCEGLYTFTLWVKDKAGNIAYEPHGSVTVGVDLPTPPPPVTAPLAPGNFTLTPNGQNVTLTWTDNASNEDGYQLYRNEAPLKTLSANASSYSDSNLAYGQAYSYKLYAFKGSLNSEAVTGTITLTAPPSGDYHYADSFIYPVACPDNRIYHLETDSQIPNGACFDYQPLGSLFAYILKIHQGADVNFKGINDKGKPLYSIANALVWDYGWVSGWGNYLILRIQANPGKSFRLTDGTTTAEIFALYAHLDEIKVIKSDGQTIAQSALIKKQTYLAKGWQIGTIGDADGIYSPHLHFEIRINGYDQLGHGYWPVDDQSYLTYFVDPIEFIDNNKDAQTPVKIIVHGYDRISSRKVYLNFTSGIWQRQGRVNDGLPLASVGNSNYIWLTDSSNYTTASWDFYVPFDGAYGVYMVLPRYYGQAKGIQYEIWHSSQNQANPYKVTLDQTNSDANRMVYLGSFDYKSGGKNSVGIKVPPTNYPVQKVALDTLILVYEGDLGTGGGPALPPTDEPVQLQTIYSDGDLTFRYDGTYNSPRLLCWGSSLENQNPIFNNGIKTATVEVLDSSSVWCNIEFEDGNWMGQSYGILPGHKLFVNNTEITSALDNHQGGTNLVFNLDVDSGSGDTTVPPVDDGDTTHTYSIHVSGKVDGLGCTLSNPAETEGEINLLILFLPFMMVFAIRATQRLRSK